MKKWNKPQIIVLDVVATEKIKIKDKYNRHKPHHS